MGDRLLEVTNLCVERGERSLIYNLNAQFEIGQITQVSGPNGAGKTTLLRTLCGLISPEAGIIAWRGNPSSPRLYSDEIFYLGHKPAVSMQLTPIENLRQFQISQSLSLDASDSSDFIGILSKVGLSGYEDEICTRLSAGQKRRVGLAKLLISDASVWILDEPFTAIDAKGVEFLCARMADFAAKGGVVVFTTHQPVSFPGYDHKVIDLALFSGARD